MKTLISGGAGFIGSHLVDRLISEGHEVKVIDDLSNGSIANIQEHLDSGRIKFFEQDISSQVDRRFDWGKPEVIYHLACWPRSRSFKNPVRDVEVNLISMIKVLEYARCCDARIVFSSNSGIYDSTIQPIREGNPDKPTTPYDVNKLASEHMIKAYSEAYGIKYTIFRFATVYGPRQRVTSEWNPVIATFIDTLRRGETPYITGDGHQTRDFIYVSDIVDALIKGSEGPSVGPLLLGSGVETSIVEALETVCDVMNTSVTFNVRPPPLGEIQRMSYDCSRAREALSWAPKVSLDVGVANCLKYLLRKG